MPSDFGVLSDSDFIGKMRELNEYIHLSEGMANPTQKTGSKRNEILNRMRDLVANNRDKLFKRTGPKALEDGSVVEGEEVKNAENIPF
jgi:hypothetical protein